MQEAYPVLKTLSPGFFPERGAAAGSGQSARGLAHSKTLRVIRKSPDARQRLGLRRPSAAFHRCQPTSAAK
jgi:hypothetical protein